jgi:hypothetical protein
MIRRQFEAEPIRLEASLLAEPVATIWNHASEPMWQGPLSECQDVLYSMVARGVEFSHWNAEPPEGETEPLNGYRL